MKSKLAITVILFGWVIFISYIFYDYVIYESGTIWHFFHPPYTYELFFHILMLTVPIGSSITGYLINERKKLLVKTQLSEKGLKRAAEEWKTTFDSMPYGVMLIDNEFNIIRANNYIANLSGIPLKELLFKKKCYEVIHKQDKSIYGCPLEKSIKTNRRESLEYYETHHGKNFMVNVTPLFDDDGAVLAYVHSIIDITDIKQKEKKLIESRDAFLNMLKDIDSAYKELKILHQSLIVAFANAIDAKSPWTRGHSERVTNYAVSIAKEMGLKEQAIENLRTAALLHDIGKIGTYDIILDKSDKLTDEECSLIRMHTAKGEEILKPIKDFEHILPIIRFHHERLDGKGYPNGLKGEEIPLLSRILCVADSFDSMTSDRPYSPALEKKSAIQELRHCSGTQFDPQVVEAFLKVLEKTLNPQP